jgi:prepilin-type N-terminal cleavage/methylation domain-containing protein/prepilin-type processing-associated H-X9-DG protein
MVPEDTGQLQGCNVNHPAYIPRRVKNRFPFPGLSRQDSSSGFTLLELLVVVAIIALLASLLLPALAKAKGKGQSIYCLSNLKQLDLGWLLYAHDNNDRLPYNLGATEIKKILARGEHYNWANSVLNWELDSDNTNRALNVEAALGTLVGRNSRVFKCPVDTVVSSIQRRSGWSERSRSFSMNAMVGDAGEFTQSGININNPSYVQYMKLNEISAPSETFVMIEEHPDSVNDGYFLNRAEEGTWTDLPASYHDGAANLSFADGHAEKHRWTDASTKRPAKPDAAGLPLALKVNERSDFYWLARRTSAYNETSDLSTPESESAATK